MLYLENNTTFSGSDIKVYAYRDVSDFNQYLDSDERKVKRVNTDDLYPDDPFRNSTAAELDEMLQQSVADIASGRITAEPETYTAKIEGGSDMKELTPGDAYQYELAGYTLTKDPVKLNSEAVQTNRVNPNFTDIIRTGGTQALKASRDYQLAKQTANRNSMVDSKGRVLDRSKPIVELGSLYSITYSSFREKNAVRTIGRVSAKAYTRGQRTIAGSMNFAVFQSHELMDFMKTGQYASEIVILDQLPKFNLMLIMINEYGGASVLHLFGVTISTESQQTSVEDLALMNNVTFYAEDIMTIEDVGNVFETSLSMLHPTVIAGKTLRFYKKNDFTTLGSLLSINGKNNNRDSKIDNLLSRSRGLF